MSWDNRTWDGFCALIAGSWGGDFTDAERTAYRVLLDDLEPATAFAAVKRLTHSGRQFYPRPTASDIAAAAREDVSAPTFDEMLVLFCRSLKAGGGELWLREHTHPLVWSFVGRQGFNRMRMLPLDDPDWGERHRRDLRAAWDRHVQAFDGREVAALTAGRSQGMRQLDPLASIPVAQPQIGGSQNNGPLQTKPNQAERVTQC